MSAGHKNKLMIEQLLRHEAGSLQVVKEYKFHPVRRWRFDYACPALKIAVEYQGHAGMIGGKASGHSTISGLVRDCEKINQAANLGWSVYLFTALHFTERDRIKHKLMHPADTLHLAFYLRRQ